MFMVSNHLTTLIAMLWGWWSVQRCIVHHMSPSYELQGRKGSSRSTEVCRGIDDRYSTRPIGSASGVKSYTTQRSTLSRHQERWLGCEVYCFSLVHSPAAQGIYDPSSPFFQRLNCSKACACLLHLCLPPPHLQLLPPHWSSVLAACFCLSLLLKKLQHLSSSNIFLTLLKI